MATRRALGHARTTVRPSLHAVLLVIVGLVACRHGHDAATPDTSVDGGPQPATLGALFPSTPTSSTAAHAKLASRAMETWVYEQPSFAGKRLGYLRAGAIVQRHDEAAGHKECPGGWYEIAPRGYVCIGKDATLDLDDPIVKASARRPDLSAGLPYGYAVVRNDGSPFYTRIPTATEAKALEHDWDHHFRTLTEAEQVEAQEGGYPQLSSVPDGPLPIEPAAGVLAPWATDNKDDPLPPFLEHHGLVPNLSGLAWAQRVAFEGGTSCDPTDRSCVPVDAARPKKKLGISFVDTLRVPAGDDTTARRYLLTTDLLLMPADRVRLVRGTSFHGVDLGAASGLELPIVFVKKEHSHRYSFDGHRMKEGDELGWRSALSAGTKQRIVGSKHYTELKDGSFVLVDDTVRLDPIKKLPKWGKDGERWIEVNLTKQTLLAVDGDKPVYATLVSTGAGGLAPQSAENPYVTPRGIFRIHTKHTAATMDSTQPEAEFELRDVPYIQYFKDGYALHAAYWHDQFGMPRSHGCVNLAPIDAKWLFGFTKPELPAEWHGVMQALTGTIVWVHA
ncbi:MAG: L,D-transpeptidase [Polyangiales bacterium]